MTHHVRASALLVLPLLLAVGLTSVSPPVAATAAPAIAFPASGGSLAVIAAAPAQMKEAQATLRDGFTPVR